MSVDNRVSIRGHKGLGIASLSEFDPVAPNFDTHRAIPGSALEAIRTAILEVISLAVRPRLLDIGAGTGRIGLPFVAAGNDYVGVDMSLGMLRQFAERSRRHVDQVPRLAQSDGQFLPFCDAAFDGVMMINVVGGLRVDWRRLIAEARRVLRPTGALFVGRTAPPTSGIDEQIRSRLAFILRKMGVLSDKRDARLEVLRHLELAAESSAQVVPAAWEVERTPRMFLQRQQSGARFSALPTPVKEEALSKLSAWAVTKFGSLDAVHSERYVFELRVFKFQEDGIASMRKTMEDTESILGAPRNAAASSPSSDRPANAVDPELFGILVCPLTKGPIECDAAKQELISRSAKLAYPIRDGIPIMLSEEARRLE